MLIKIEIEASFVWGAWFLLSEYFYFFLRVVFSIWARKKDRLMLENFRVLHAAQMRTPAVGIARQMREEQRVAESNGMLWCSRLFVPFGGGVNEICIESEVPPANKWAFKKSFFQWLSDASKDFDVILLRHSLYSPEEVRFIRNSSKPIFLVHHTLEVPELLTSRGLVGKLLALGERYFGGRAISAAAGIVAVTSEIGSYERHRAGRDLPVYLYPNGLVLGKKSGLRDERTGDVPELVFVASHFLPWHGLDILIKAVEASSDTFRINLVGCLSDEQRESIKEDPRFVEHGLLTSEQISDIVARSWVGIGSLALDRIDMLEACPLKVREYLAGGLPVYAGYADIFPSDFSFFKKGAVEMGCILAFARAVRSISREDVVAAATPFIEKGALITSLYNKVRNDCLVRHF